MKTWISTYFGPIQGQEGSKPLGTHILQTSKNSPNEIKN